MPRKMSYKQALKVVADAVRELEIAESHFWNSEGDDDTDEREVRQEAVIDALMKISQALKALGLVMDYWSTRVLDIDD